MRIFLCKNLSMEDVRIKGWYTSPPSLTPSVFVGKDVFDMTAIERMVAAGMSEAAAAETATWYMAQGDEDGLEAYVISLEALSDMEARRGIRTLQS